MRKAFTLIELVIVISIITIMAVLAIPAFNNYGAKNDLDAKAEEIKLAIQTAYKQAESPPKGANGVEVAIVQSPAALSVTEFNFNESCMTIYDTDCGTPVSSSNLIYLDSYFYFNDLGSSSAKIRIKTPAGSNNIYSSLGDNISFKLVSSRANTNPIRTIEIKRLPIFSVATLP